MAVSGLPEPCEDNARCIARLALDLMDMSQGLKNPNGELITVRPLPQLTLASCYITISPGIHFVCLLVLVFYCFVVFKVKVTVNVRNYITQ